MSMERTSAGSFTLDKVINRMSSVSVKQLALCTLGASVLLLSGCSTSEVAKTADAKSVQNYTVQLAQVKTVTAQQVAKPVASVPRVSKLPVEAHSAVTVLDRVVWNAQKQQGKMYRYGGESPKTGFDCSGLTRFAFGTGAGLTLPRTAAAQYASVEKISQDQANKGDLVFFNTSGRRVSHVGIYLGDNKFVHAPRTGRSITTEKLEGYWSARLVGFGRVPGACKPAYS